MIRRVPKEIRARISFGSNVAPQTAAPRRASREGAKNAHARSDGPTTIQVRRGRLARLQTPRASRISDAHLPSRAVAMATRDGGGGGGGGGERAGETTDAATPTAPPVPASWSEQGRRRARDARVLLVPVDGGATAETAMVLRWVAENVHRPGDRVHVLHVVPPSSWRRQEAAAEVRRRGEANERPGVDR